MQVTETEEAEDGPSVALPVTRTALGLIYWIY